MASAVAITAAPPSATGHDRRRRIVTAILLSVALAATAAALLVIRNEEASPSLLPTQLDNDGNDHHDEFAATAPSADEDLFSSSSSSSSSSTTHRLLARATRILKSTPRRHKPLLPLDGTDKLGFFFATLGLVIAAGGGIGGGGVLVPIYILVMKFSPKHAIPLSNITVFGGAVANTILNVRKRHPLADRPLVDWDLILVMEPLTIAGALMGAFLNKLLPEAMLVVSLVALLSFTAYKTLRKATRMYRAETQAMLAEKGRVRIRGDGTKESELTRMARELEEEEDDEMEERQGVALLEDVGRHEGDVPGDMELTHNVLDNGNGEGAGSEEENGNEEDANDVENAHPNSPQQQKQHYHDTQSSAASDSSSVFSSATDLQNKQDLARILEEERHIPPANVQVLCLTFGVVLFINLLKGGGAFRSPLGIRCGSPSFWAANGLMIGWILLVSVFARGYLVRRCALKERVGYPYAEGDIRWDARSTVIYPLVCTAAGFFAGMFGVGGGIVKGPLMLAMGVHPKVSSASSACMILFTSFTATTSFVVFGLLDMEYAAICLALGFVATLVGQIGLFYLMERFQRNSYIAFSIGGIVLLSAFLMTIQSLLSMADSGGPRPPSGLCTGKQQ